MVRWLYKKIRSNLLAWLSYEPPSSGNMPLDFNRLKQEIKPGDILLVEGRSRVSNVIATLTRSPWTHSAIYIGRLIDLDDDTLREQIKTACKVKDKTRLLVEDLLDQGTVITPLNFYNHHHLRICRPIGITPSDRQLMLNYVIKALGQPYNIRQIFDLARFLLPWAILPRRWGSSLFRTPTGEAESGVCSSLIAEAFASVQFPVLPFMKHDDQDNIRLYKRNPYLYTPKDFDYSPYFEIIKYPLFNPDEPLPYYRRLPWTKSGLVHQDHGILSGPKKKRRSIFSRNNADTDENAETEIKQDAPTQENGKE